MTGLWWWQNYQKSNEERDNLVQTYVEKEKTAEVPVTHSNDIPVAVNNQPLTSNNETAPVTEAKIMLLNLLFPNTQENQVQPVNAEVSTGATSPLTVEQVQALLWNKPYLTQNLQQSQPYQMLKVRLKIQPFLKRQPQQKAILLLRLPKFKLD